MTEEVHTPESELCNVVALLGRQAIPAHGFGIVLRDALAQVILVPEFDLSIGVACSAA